MIQEVIPGIVMCVMGFCLLFVSADKIWTVEEKGYKIAGQPRTCYIDGAWNQDDPEKWLSVIQIPIE